MQNPIEMMIHEKAACSKSCVSVKRSEENEQTIKTVAEKKAKGVFETEEINELTKDVVAAVTKTIAKESEEKEGAEKKNENEEADSSANDDTNEVAKTPKKADAKIKFKMKKRKKKN